MKKLEVEACPLFKVERIHKKAFDINDYHDSGQDISWFGRVLPAQFIEELHSLCATWRGA